MAVQFQQNAMFLILVLVFLSLLSSCTGQQQMRGGVITPHTGTHVSGAKHSGERHSGSSNYLGSREHNRPHSTITNVTIAGTGTGCTHTSEYFTNTNTRFKMCMGQSNQDLKNGMSIINLVNSRGFLPTCRVMQLMLWMAAQVNDKPGTLVKDTFVDVGANIGSCTVHMASMGFPVVSVEPVQQHVDTIRGSINVNPAFQIELHHVGISSEDRSIRATFGHGGRNWGATAINEIVNVNETSEVELQLKTLDQLVGHRRVSLLKIDCEGCEWAALKSGRRTLKKTPMIKIELVQPHWEDGNQTMSASDIILFLNRSNYDTYVDHWNEQSLYFGNHGKEVLDIDRLFGSARHSLGADEERLNAGAHLILSKPLDPATFNHKNFLKSYTDVIAIERSLSKKMKEKWLK